MIKLIQVNPDAVRPEYQTPGAAGFDVGAYWSDADKSPRIICPHETLLIGTGWKMQCDKGWGLFALPRSGIASKRGLRPANAPGLIDCDYTGEVMIALHNQSNDVQAVEYGERIAQIACVYLPQQEFYLVDEFEATARGSGGFGSTGT